jgi:hypothetical protein
MLLTLQRMDAEVLPRFGGLRSAVSKVHGKPGASVEGVIADAEIYAQPWGPLENQVLVRLWPG